VFETFPGEGKEHIGTCAGDSPVAIVEGMNGYEPKMGGFPALSSGSISSSPLNQSKKRRTSPPTSFAGGASK
jgi:hypothetical protein